MVQVVVKGVPFGAGAPLVLVSGPCVIESESAALETAEALSSIAGKAGIPLVYKSSYDKANRTSIHAYRGPGLDEGLRILEKIRSGLGLPVLSDVHTPEEARAAANVLDVLQIPAFLCRQTDLIVAAAKTGKPINIKKGQFMAPWDMEHTAAKAVAAGNNQILFTERGASFGYNNLVVDFRNVPIMQGLGWPVIFDATHSVQLPGGSGSCSGGDRRFAPVLARAAVAAGVDAVFFEVHKNPDKALCDGPNSLDLESLGGVLRQLKGIREAVGDAAAWSGEE
jgi:2-dehydro-3-deoxyphosphooctonate aldolase (KDO 8-P synthase)